MFSKELDRSEWSLMSKVVYEIGIYAVAFVVSVALIVMINKLFDL